jgi:hypothetical protein
LTTLTYVVCILFQDVALLELRCFAHVSKDLLRYDISSASFALMFRLWVEFCLVMKTPCPVDTLMGRGDTPDPDFGPILPHEGTGCYKWYQR